MPLLLNDSPLGALEASLDVVYYAACSLDGYIATVDGGVEWLTPFQGKKDDHGFADFYATVDSLVMGSHTYEFSLRHPPWMAPDKPSWVFTHRGLDVADTSVTLTSQEPREVMELMRARGLKRVWLMGGGKLAASFRMHGLITCYMIAVVPVVLGSGIPLLASSSRQDELRLTHANTYPSGIVQLCYEPMADV